MSAKLLPLIYVIVSFVVGLYIIFVILRFLNYLDYLKNTIHHENYVKIKLKNLEKIGGCDIFTLCIQYAKSDILEREFISLTYIENLSQNYIVLIGFFDYFKLLYQEKHKEKISEKKDLLSYKEKFLNDCQKKISLELKKSNKEILKALEKMSEFHK